MRSPISPGPPSEDILADWLYDHDDPGQRLRWRLSSFEGLAFHDVLVSAAAPAAGMVRPHAQAVSADRSTARPGPLSRPGLPRPFPPGHAVRPGPCPGAPKPRAPPRTPGRAPASACG